MKTVVGYLLVIGCVFLGLSAHAGSAVSHGDMRLSLEYPDGWVEEVGRGGDVAVRVRATDGSGARCGASLQFVKSLSKITPDDERRVQMMMSDRAFFENMIKGGYVGEIHEYWSGMIGGAVAGFVDVRQFDDVQGEEIAQLFGVTVMNQRNVSIICDVPSRHVDGVRAVAMKMAATIRIDPVPPLKVVSWDVRGVGEGMIFESCEFTMDIENVSGKRVDAFELSIMFIDGDGEMVSLFDANRDMKIEAGETVVVGGGAKFFDEGLFREYRKDMRLKVYVPYVLYSDGSYYRR